MRVSMKARMLATYAELTDIRREVEDTNYEKFNLRWRHFLLTYTGETRGRAELLKDIDLLLVRIDRLEERMAALGKVIEDLKKAREKARASSSRKSPKK
jgi:hypothetical protein